MEQKRTGMLFAVISAVSWGTYGTLYSLLLAAGIRDLTLVALAPLAMVVYFGIRVCFKPGVLKAISLKYCIGMVLQGVVITNGMNYCYSQAYVNGMAVGIVSVIAFSNVLVIMVESYFLMKYRFTAAKIVSMVLAVIGISLVLDIFTGEHGVFTAAGLMWTVLIPLFYGTNVTLNSFFIVKECDSDAILFITQLAAFVFMIIVQIHPTEIFSNISAVIMESHFSIWYLLGFIGIPTVLCFAMMQEALKRMEPSIMGIAYSLDPVTSLILGIFVFGQGIGFIQFIGVLLIIAAVVYINHAEGKEAVVIQENLDIEE